MFIYVSARTSRLCSRLLLRRFQTFRVLLGRCLTRCPLPTSLRRGADPSYRGVYLRAPEISLNSPLMRPDKADMPAIMATAISDASRPYSIAVAPDSLAKNFLMVITEMRSLDLSPGPRNISVDRARRFSGAPRPVRPRVECAFSSIYCKKNQLYRAANLSQSRFSKRTSA